MPLSTFTKERLTEHILGQAPWDRGNYPVNTYFSLHTDDPEGTGTDEANYSGYTRVLANWNNATTAGATNSGVHNFPVVNTTVTVTHIGLWTALSGGDFLFSIPVGSTEFLAGAAPKILDQGVTITPGPAYHNNTRIAITDHLTGKAEYSFNPVYLALFTTTPTQSTNGAETSGGSYARQQIEFDPWASDLIDNTNIENFPDATNSLGTINGVAIMSAATNGLRILVGDVTTPALVNNGDSYQVGAGDLDITTS